jgi:hypothetical protein
VDNKWTIRNKAGTELHNLLMGSITMFLSDFKEICLVTWGNTKEEGKQVHHYFNDKSYTKCTWEVTQCLF